MEKLKKFNTPPGIFLPLKIYCKMFNKKRNLIFLDRLFYLLPVDSVESRETTSVQQFLVNVFFPFDRTVFDVSPLTLYLHKLYKFECYSNLNIFYDSNSSSEKKKRKNLDSRFSLPISSHYLTVSPSCLIESKKRGCSSIPTWFYFTVL